MATGDVVHYSLDTFLGCRRLGLVDERVRERIEDIFRRYSCFGATAAAAAASTATATPSGGGRRNGGHGHRRSSGRNATTNTASSSTPPPSVAATAPPLLPRTPEKSLQGLLNKVTQTNITTLLPQIMAVNMPSGDKATIILRHAGKQRGYHELFLRMIYSLRETDTQVVEDAMYAYVDDAMKQTWLLSVDEEDPHDYDGFCERLKTQNYYLGRVHTSLGILTMPLSRRTGICSRRGPYRALWYEYMCKAWAPPLWPSTQAVSIALYLEAWDIWVQTCPQFTERYMDIARNILEETATNLPAKLRFKAMDILDKYGPHGNSGR